VNVKLSPEQEAALNEVASRLKVPAEELVRAAVADLLGRTDEDFRTAAKHVLEKNQDLYKRLA
jgi:hypothetical protein